MRNKTIFPLSYRNYLTRIVFFVSASLFTLPSIAEIAVVVSSKSATANLSKEQIADIFMGKSTALTPIDQADSNPIREEFYAKVVGKSSAQAKAYWAKLSFTGKGTPPKEFPNNDEVKKALAANSNLVGYLEKSAADASVKVLFSAP